MGSSGGEMPFSDVRLGGSPLSECEMVLECGANNAYKLYVKRGEGHFHAVALDFVATECTEFNPRTSEWIKEDDRVEQLFEASALFDGVRHLEFNREAGDMAGYIYYPDIQGLVDLFTKLRQLEIEICPSHE